MAMHNSILLAFIRSCQTNMTNYIFLAFISNQQEGADKISVFGLQTRTQAAVEAYNGYLGNRIIAHPNLFVLINALRDEELHKSRDFQLLFSTANPPLQRRCYRIRDKKIKDMSKLLINKQIDVDTFLNGVACPENNVFEDRHFNFQMMIDDNGMSEAEEIEPAEEDLPASTDHSAVSGKTCIICLDAVSTILLSCGHFKYCLECFNTEKANFEKKLDDSIFFTALFLADIATNMAKVTSNFC